MHFALLTLLFCIAALPALAEPLKVVTSIKPVHSMVAAVMQGTGNEPALLVDGAVSPHSYTLKPSDRLALEQADLVFFIEKDFEAFMEKVLSSLPVSAKAVTLKNAPGLMLYKQRIEEDGEADGYDPHIWLSPANAGAMVMEIARELSQRDPQHEKTYKANAARYIKQLDALDADLARRMQKLRGLHFVVFHDAYQYFERYYGLTSIGAVMEAPGQSPGAKYVHELRETLKANDAKCVFVEPSFDQRIVGNIVEGTSVRIGTLDPEGASLAPGPDLYTQLMQAIASALESCLLNGGR